MHSGCTLPIPGLQFHANARIGANFTLTKLWDSASPASEIVAGCAVEQACRNISVPLDHLNIPATLQPCLYLQRLLAGVSPPKRAVQEHSTCLATPAEQETWLYSQLSVNLTSADVTLQDLCKAITISRHSWNLQSTRIAAGGHVAEVEFPDRHRWERANNFSAPFNPGTCTLVCIGCLWCEYFAPDLCWCRTGKD